MPKYRLSEVHRGSQSRGFNPSRGPSSNPALSAKRKSSNSALPNPKFKVREYGLRTTGSSAVQSGDLQLRYPGGWSTARSGSFGYQKTPA